VQYWLIHLCIPLAALGCHALQKGRVEQKVRVALQVTGGARLQESFDPSMTLWELLGKHHI
jgi:hypothetical protein